MTEGDITSNQVAMGRHVFSHSPEGHLPSRSTPPARDTLHFSAVYPNRSDWPLLSVSSPSGAEIEPEPTAPQSALSLKCGSAKQRRFSNSGFKKRKGHGGRLPSHESGCVTSEREGRCWWKSREESMLSRSLEKMEGAKRSPGSPQDPLPTALSHSLCRIKDAAINVYGWSDLEVGVVVLWRSEPNVCFRAIKTSVVFVLHFNYRVIVGHLLHMF